MSDYTVEVNIKDLEDEIKKNIDIIIHNLLKRFIEENKIETLYKIINPVEICFTGFIINLKTHVF